MGASVQTMLSIFGQLCTWHFSMYISVLSIENTYNAWLPFFSNNHWDHPQRTTALKE